MAVSLRVLATAEAQAVFGAMPQAQRPCSLSPLFAQADTARAEGLRCVHVAVRDGEHAWLHTTHLRTVRGGGAQAAISPYGYGGPVCSSDDPAFVAAAWRAYTQWAAQENVLGELCRFHPEAGHHRFFLGEVSANRATISVDLALPALASQFNTLARRKLRRAQGVAVRWTQAAPDWQRYGPFYRAAMQAMGADARYHFGDGYFAAIAAVPGAWLCICEEGGAWLSAGVYLFQAPAPGDAQPGGTAEYHLGASSAEGHARGTAYLLQEAAAQEGRRRGLAQLYLGGGTTTAADDPLLFYKRAFSRRERVFHLGRAVHAPDAHAAYVRSRGYDLQSAPATILFD